MTKRWMIAGAVSALAAGACFAQDQDPVQTKEHRRMVFTQDVAGPGMAGAVGVGGTDVMTFRTSGPESGNFVFMSTEMSFEGSVVKGAPYSADAVTETTQTLSDGNHISRKTSSSLYRDSEGRTRREQSLPAIGPWATSGTPPVNVFINDPVSGVNYILESNSKTARKLGLGKIRTATAGKPMGVTFNRAIAPPEVGAVRMESKAAAPVKEEKLPSQLIEGVQAEGTRSTITIPAGEVGNEREIQIVSERWYSPELKTVVMTKHSDPRMGETVYKLTNLQRAEPARSLFEVPADYTLKDDFNPDNLKEQKMLIEKMIIEKGHEQ